MDPNNGVQFQSPFNGGNQGPASFDPGSNFTGSSSFDPRFVSNADPTSVVTTFDQNRRRLHAESRDFSNNVIARTTNFDQNGNPVFDPATGLSSNGFRRVAAATTGSTGQIPSGTVLPDASLQQVRLNDGSLGWAQARSGQPLQTLEVITSAGTAFQQNGNVLTPVAVSPGDLVTRDRSGRLVLADRTVSQELMKKYQGMSPEARTTLESSRPGAGALVDSVVSRQSQVGTTTPTGSTTANPTGTSGTHTGGQTTGTGDSPIRPVDPTTAPTNWSEFKSKFDKGEIPDPEKVGNLVKKWEEPTTGTAAMKMFCVSNVDKSKKDPMTFFLTRSPNPDKPGEWINKVRLDSGEIESSKAEIDQNRDREVVLAKDETRKSWYGNRKFFPNSVEYDLRTVEVLGIMKFWMKVTSASSAGNLEYICGESEPKREKKNDAEVPQPPKPGLDSQTETKPPDQTADLKEDATTPEGSLQISEKDTKVKMPPLLSKCASCHGADSGQDFVVGTNGVFLSKSAGASKFAAAQFISEQVDRMVKVKLKGSPQPAEVQTLKDWLAQVQGESR